MKKHSDSPFDLWHDCYPDARRTPFLGGCMYVDSTGAYYMKEYAEEYLEDQDPEQKDHIFYVL